MNVNFRDKNFVIATFFHDHLHAVAPAQTIHVVTPPTILTCGIEACKCEEKQIKISLSRFEF